MNNCQKCVFFEAKKKKDLFMWCVHTIMLVLLNYELCDILNESLIFTEVIIIDYFIVR